MPHRCWLSRITCALAGALLSLTGGMIGWAIPAQPAGQENSTAPPMSDAEMAHMPGHMYMTALRSPKAGDQLKADAVIEAARTAMAPDQDYRKA